MDIKLKRRKKFQILWGDEAKLEIVGVFGNEIMWDIHPGYTFFIHRPIDNEGKPRARGWSISEKTTGHYCLIRYGTKKETLEIGYTLLPTLTSSKIAHDINRVKREAFEAQGLPFPLNQ